MPYIGTSPSNGVRRVHTYTATASQTTFTGASSEGVTLSYADTNYIDVFQNGVLLGSDDYTATSGTSVVLSQSASSSDLIVIICYDVFSVADTVSKTNGGSFDSAVTMSDNLTVSGAFTSQGIDDNADATAITIDSSEQVAIGTSSPENNLHIFTDGNAEGLTIKSTGNTSNAIIIDANRSGSTQTINQLLGRWNGTDVAEISFQTGTDTSNKDDGLIKFRTSKTGSLVEVMRITQSNNVTIGSTTAFAKLHVASQGDVTTPALFEDTRTGSTSTTCIVIKRNGTNVGAINTTNNTTSYVTSSDYRLKENVDYTFDATTRLKQLKPCRYNFITEPDTTLDGFLAHEVSHDADGNQLVPEAISGTHNELEVWREGEELPDGVSVGDNKLDDDGNTIPRYQGIDQSKLVPLLVKTIQELEARITALENAE